MNLENDDIKRAIDAASNIVERSRQRKIGLPLGSAYWLGMALVSTMPKDTSMDKIWLRASLVGKLEHVVPRDLIEKGTDNCTDDLGRRVPLSINTIEYEHCGEAVLSVPSGRTIIGALPLDPADRAELDGYRNKQLRAFLTLHDEFSNVGGTVSEELKGSVENELS